jgi:hypothetical protein
MVVTAAMVTIDPAIKIIALTSGQAVVEKLADIGSPFYEILPDGQGTLGWGHPDPIQCIEKCCKRAIGP